MKSKERERKDTEKHTPDGCRAKCNNEEPVAVLAILSANKGVT
jgi:hypothetical protein